MAEMFFFSKPYCGVAPFHIANNLDSTQEVRIKSVIGFMAYFTYLYNIYGYFLGKKPT